jgi:uncharacterized repeat protein (TIGR03803 family)
MNKYQTVFRDTLLGSALAVIALAPAMGANASNADLKRLRALEGNRNSAVHAASVGAQAAKASERASHKATYTVLYKFLGGKDGSGSGANVTFDGAGNLYGTTDFGGANADGVVFKLAPDGTETLLHTFSGSDGDGPDGAVIVRPNGDIYGSTGAGGVSGNGLLFSLSAKGKFKVLHDFTTADGSFIRGNLYRDKTGNLYGTALFSGANGSGTVFKYGADGTFTVLHTFAADGSDGQYPEHGVVADKAGNLYGVTAFGGANGEGTVYKLDTSGKLTTLHSFTGGADGGFLYGGLAIDKDGALYGSTVDGGASSAGTVFEISPAGTLTTLYSFAGGSDIGGPEGDVHLVGNNLDSTATTGGDPSCQCGGIYELSLKGKEKVLHAFTGSDGSGYSAGVTSQLGLLYGTVQAGGVNQNGVVFSVSKK